MVAVLPLRSTVTAPGTSIEMQAVRVKADLDRYLGLRTAHGADAPVNADVHRHTRVGREAAGIEKLVRLPESARGWEWA